MAIAWGVLADLSQSLAAAEEIEVAANEALPIQLLCEPELAKQFADHLPAGFSLQSIDDLISEELVARAAAGESVV